MFRIHTPSIVEEAVTMMSDIEASKLIRASACNINLFGDAILREDWLPKIVRTIQHDVLIAAAKVCAPMSAEQVRLLGGEMTTHQVRLVQSFLAAAERGILALKEKPHAQ